MLSEMTESDHRFGQCRCCLNVGYHKDIAEPYHRNGARETYLETFLKCFNLVLSKDKKLINMICESCINRLNDATEFKAMVVESERQLLSRTESVSSNTELTYVGQDNDTGVQKYHNNTIIKKEEDNDWNNDGDEMDTQDVVEEQATESVDNDENIELATEVKRNAPLRQLQVKLTRLPTFLLKLFIKEPYGNNSLEADPDLGLHTELDIKWEPERELKEEPQDCGVDFVLATSDDDPDLGLHTELDIKWEPEGELKEEPQDCGVDFVLATDDDGPAIELKLTTIETTETHEEIDPNNLILRRNKQTGIQYRTEKINKINKDMKVLDDVKKTDNILLSSNFIKKQSIDSDYLGKCLTTQYSCTLCKYTTNTKKYFKYHLKDHSPPEKNYICDTCSYITARRSAFLAHLKLHAGDNPFGCEKCGRKFASRHGLINHDRTHTGEKPFSCEICGKTFIQISILRRHIRTHTGEKPYACKICGKKFSQKGSLITHDKTHTGEKPYACEFCDAKFARKDNLKSHVQTHTGERPHACKICDKRFISTSDVRKHMRRHTGEMPYSCKICNENLCSISDLRKHTETHRDEK